MSKLLQLTVLFFVCVSLMVGCGDEDSVMIDCSTLTPCAVGACRSCGWGGSCAISSGTLVSTDLPTAGDLPYFLVLDIEVMSQPQGGERACANAVLMIQNPQGTRLNTPLALDDPKSFCIPSAVGGLTTITLSCDDGFPTRGRYRISILDSMGRGVWP